MRKSALFVAAFVLTLGLAQCKKEQPATPQSEGNVVTITLNVGDSNGSRVNVNPTGTDQVTFTDGDTILVANGGKYVGALGRADGVFSGNITNPVEGQKLYFYFLGNKADVSQLTAGSSTTCTVNISDQTGYPNLPVISMGKSTVNYSSDVTSYSSRLYNKCSLQKFNVTTPSAAAICITGMNNKVTVDFGNPTDEGFEYGMEGEGVIKMKGGWGTNVEKWAIVLPNESSITDGMAYSEDNYTGTFSIGAIEANKFYDSGIAMTVNTFDLSTLTSNHTAQDGEVLTGTLAQNVKVYIDRNATVTLDGVSINADGRWTTGSYAGLNCDRNATIILKDGTTNTVRGFNRNYPGIHVPPGYTLTIKGGSAGTGSLTASSNGSGAGIGGGVVLNCGNILIEGGIINATGGSDAAGIGGGYGAEYAKCGNITISGGTITATGGVYAPGIGGGCLGSCGAITITTGVTSVTATKGKDAPNSIGKGDGGSCGTVTIGGVVYSGGIETSPYTYEP